MTPEDFVDAYLPTAQEVHASTGIDPVCLLAQWANETAWGSAWAGAPNNLGNIRCSPTSFCQYSTLNEFATAASVVWHQSDFINTQYPHGFEPFRATAAASDPAGALQAIIASPWDAGHYGGSLATYYAPLAALFPVPDPSGGLIVAMAGVLHRFLRGVDLALYHCVEQADGSVGPWVLVGGRLGSSAIYGGALSSGHLVITVDGAQTNPVTGGIEPDGFKYDYLFDGSSWTGPTKNGQGDGMLVLGASGDSGGSVPAPKAVSGTFTGTVT